MASMGGQSFTGVCDVGCIQATASADAQRIAHQTALENLRCELKREADVALATAQRDAAAELKREVC